MRVRLPPRPLLAALLFFWFLWLPIPADAASKVPADELLSGRVGWIYDGDTLKVEGLGKVRLLGIDAPEHENSERDRFYRRWGIPPSRLRQVARDGVRFSVTRVKNRVVTLRFDRSRRDAYGRLLAYVFLPMILRKLFNIRKN